MCSHTFGISACTNARVRSDSVRTVPSSSAVSGMMLDVVPAVIRPTVSTAGSNTLNRRVTIVCSAPTIAAAAGTGSIARSGIAPWPPLPVTVTVYASALAIIGPGLHITTPDCAVDVMCSANACSTGRPAGLEHALLQHVPRAVLTFLAGLEHEHDLAGQRVPPARAAAARRTRASRCGCRGRRRASTPSVSDANASPLSSLQRQRVHVATQQHGRSGPLAVEHRGHRAARLAGADVQAEALERVQHRRLRPRQVEALLGVLVQLPAQRHGARLQRAGSVEQAGEPRVVGQRCGGHPLMIASVDPP